MLSRLVTANHRFRFVEKGRQVGRLTSHLGKAADPTVLSLQLVCGAVIVSTAKFCLFTW